MCSKVVFVEWILLERVEQRYFQLLLGSQVFERVVPVLILPLNLVDDLLDLIVVVPIHFLQVVLVIKPLRS